MINRHLHILIRGVGIRLGSQNLLPLPKTITCLYCSQKHYFDVKNVGFFSNKFKIWIYQTRSWMTPVREIKYVIAKTDFLDIHPSSSMDIVHQNGRTMSVGHRPSKWTMSNIGPSLFWSQKMNTPPERLDRIARKNNRNTKYIAIRTSVDGVMD